MGGQAPPMTPSQFLFELCSMVVAGLEKLQVSEKLYL